MTNESQKAQLLFTQLIQSPLLLDEENHNFLLTYDRELYAALLQLGSLTDQNAMAIITRLLAITEQNGTVIDVSQKHIENYFIRQALRNMRVETVLSEMKTLVDRRVNNQRTSATLLHYILGAPNLETMAVSNRALLRKLLVHALGKHTAQNCMHFLLDEDALENHQQTYLRRNIYRFAHNPETVREIFLFIFGRAQTVTLPLLKEYLEARENIPQNSSLPYRTLKGIGTSYHKGISKKMLKRAAKRERQKRDVSLEEKQPETWVEFTQEHIISRSVITRGKRHLFLQKELAVIPQWDAHVEVIFDDSFSVQGSGSRLNNAFAIGINLIELMEQKVSKLNITRVSGRENPSLFCQPEGATNLAKPLVKAMQKEPDLVVLLSDGYENLSEGDAHQAWKAMQNMGNTTPVVHLVPVFTQRESMVDRQPLPEVPQILETGLKGFSATMLKLRLAASQNDVETALREILGLSLSRMGIPMQ